MPEPVRRDVRTSLRAISAAAVVLLLVATGAPAQVRDLDAEPDSVDSVTVGPERMDEAHSEGMDSGRPGSLDSSIEGTEQIAPRDTGSESLDARTQGSEVIEPRDLGPSSIVGSDPVEQTSAQRLEAARNALREAEARHERIRTQPGPAAVAPDAPAASEDAGDRWAEWSSRIQLARGRVQVAKARVDVLDDAYAHMMRDDYPRGADRQKLIDELQTARERLAAEQSHLPRLLEEARREGVPPGILEVQDGD